MIEHLAEDFFYLFRVLRLFKGISWETIYYCCDDRDDPRSLLVPVSYEMHRARTFIKPSVEFWSHRGHNEQLASRDARSVVYQHDESCNSTFLGSVRIRIVLCGVKRRCVNLWKPLVFRKQVDRITEGVPSEERFGLRGQLTRLRKTQERNSCRSLWHGGGWFWVGNIAGRSRVVCYQSADLDTPRAGSASDETHGLGGN